MPDITAQDLGDLASQVAAHFTQRIGLIGELAALKVAAAASKPDDYPLSSDPYSLEGVLAGGFETLPTSARDAASVRALERVSTVSSDRTARFGNLAAIDLTSAIAVDAQADSLPAPEAQRLPAEVIARLKADRPVTGQQQLRAAGDILRLQLRVPLVKCIDETSGFLGTESGHDEIFLGGSTVDAVGITGSVGPLLVGEQFEDGVEVRYDPPRVIAAFDTTSGSAWPKVFFATLVISEADNGGMSEFVDKLVQWVDEKVTAELGAAVGAAIGSVGGPAVAAIGAAIGAAVSALVDVFRDIWEDDMFEPGTFHIVVPSADSRFPGDQLHSVPDVIHFEGHGGQYDVFYDWNFEVEPVPPPVRGVIYAGNDNGELRWYRHDGRDDAIKQWAPAPTDAVGHGWADFKHVFPGGKGVIYAVQNEVIDPRTGQHSGGDLLWYRHDGRDDGTPPWSARSGKVIAFGWHVFRHVFADGDGIIYAVEPDGSVRWHQHDGREDGTRRWSPNSGTVVETGWNDLKFAFSGGDGIIYTVPNRSRDPRTGQHLGGDLLWHRHEGREDGSNRWAPGSGATVGNNWAEFPLVFGTDDGLIYAVNNRELDPVTGQQKGGDLLWYRHLGRLDGKFSWDPRSTTSVGNDWHQFRFAFAD
jgi:hypothetical protein